MVKINEFHVGKNCAISSGDWTHDPQDIGKIEKKIWTLQGLNSGPLDLKAKANPLSHADFLDKTYQKSLQICILVIHFQPILANFRHFPPPYTYIGPI